MDNGYLVRKLLGSTRRLLLFVLLIAVFIASGVGMAYFAFAREGEQPTILPSNPSLPAAGGDEMPIGTMAQKLTVNAQLQVNGQLYLAPSTLPQNAKAGMIVFDQATNTLQYFNGTQFVSLAAQQEIPEIPVATTGVTSLQGQTGDVSLTAGSGITINGTTISANSGGITAVNGTTGQVNVVTSNGEATISLPQSIATTSSPTFANMTLTGDLNLGGDLSLGSTGTLLANNLTQTGNGEDITIDAGNDNIFFVSGGRTFQFPAMAGSPQTICTTTTGCPGGGGGSFIELAPASAQSDASGNPTISVNDTGGGNLIELQSGGVDMFVVANNGDTTIDGDLNIGGSLVLSNALGIAYGGTGATTAQGAINTLSGLTTNGDLLYHNGTNSTRLPRGTNGQCLLSTGATIQWSTCTGAGGVASLSLAGTSGASQTITDGDIITLAAGTNISTTAGATDTVTIGVINNPTFSGLITANGGVTIEAGDTLTFNGDAFTDLTGTGLTISGGALQSTLGTSVTLNSAEVTGTLPVANGGTGAITFTQYGVLYGNGTGAVQVTGAGSTGQCLLGSTGAAPTWGTCPADGTGLVSFILAGTSGSSQTITDGNTVTIAAGTNITTTAGATDTVTVSVAANPTFSGLITANGGLTLEAGDTFTFNSDAFTDLTGTGLIISSGALQTTLGTSIDLASAEVTGTLPLTAGGTGAGTAQGAINAISGLTTAGDILYYNGTNATRLARGANNDCLLSNGSTILWGTCTGDGSGVTAVGSLDGQAASANGAAISGSSIYMQSASATMPGLVNTVAQSFTGVKTFTSGLTVTIGQSLTVNGDAFTDLTGDGLQIDTGVLEVDSTVCRTSGNCVGGGGGSAPSGADYLTLSLNGSLSAERVLTAGSNIGFTDGGANGALTVNVSATPSFTSITLTNALTVANGGTGAQTLTSNGVLYGNGTGAVQATAAGTTGQCLLGNTGSAPTWGTCPTDGGSLFTDGGTLTYLTSTTDDFVLGATTATGATLFHDVSAGSLRVGNGTTAGILYFGDGDGGTTTASIAVSDEGGGGGSVFNFQSVGSSGWGDLAIFKDCCNNVFSVRGTGNQSHFAYGLDINGLFTANDSAVLGSDAGDTLTINAVLQGSNALVFEGSSADANETTFVITNPTADRTITFTNATGTVVLDSVLTTEGDLYYRNGSGLTRLARGANGECLNSSATTILWGSCGSGLSGALADNIANAWDIQEGTNNYININTTNGSENIAFGNATTNPDYDFLGSGMVDISGELSVPQIYTGGLYLQSADQYAFMVENFASQDIFWVDADATVVHTKYLSSLDGIEVTNGDIYASGSTGAESSLFVGDGSSNYTDIVSAAQSGNYTVTIPTLSGNTTFCLQSNNCSYISASLTDNTTNALDIQQGSDNYININTTNSSENISFGNATTNPTFNFLGSGQLTVAGSALFQGGISAPDSGTQSEAFGLGATATATNSIAFGYNAQSTTHSSIALGHSASVVNRDGAIAIGGSAAVDGQGGVAIGSASSVTGDFAVAIGGEATSANGGVAIGFSSITENGVSIGNMTSTVDYNSIAIGNSATADYTYSIAIGSLAETTAANQLVIGADHFWMNGHISEAYIGAGVTSVNAATRDIRLQATGGEGTDIGGADFTLAGGRGTGTGAGGAIYLQTAPSGSSGSSLNTLVTRLTVEQGGNIVVGQSDTTGNLLVLDTKTDSGDPSGVNGGMYYNSNVNKFRCYQNSGWTDCITNPSGLFTDAGAYSYLIDTTDNLSIGYAGDGGAKLAVVNDANQNALAVFANATQTAPIFEIYDSAGSSLLHLTAESNEGFFLGYAAGAGNTTWDSNIGIGSYTLQTDGSYYNIAIGYGTMQNASGSANTVIGRQAMTGGDGNNNVGLGSGALGSDAGDSNVALGNGALNGLTGGSNNIALGFQAGDNLTTGNNNIIIGHNVDALSSTGNSQLVIGNLLYGDMSTQVLGVDGSFMLVDALPAGDNNTQVCRASTGILSTCTSSQRFKTNVAALGMGLDELRQLQPVTYNWTSDGRADVGFIAEQVAAIIPQAVTYTTNGEVASFNPATVTALLTRSMQQLDLQVQDHESRIANLEAAVFNGTVSTLHVTGNSVFDGTVRFNGKIISGGANATAVLGAQAAAGNVSVSGNDTAGSITYTAGNAGLTAGEQAKVVFTSAYGAQPRVTLTAASPAAAQIRYYVERTTHEFRIFFVDPPVAGQTYIFDYQILQ